MTAVGDFECFFKQGLSEPVINCHWCKGLKGTVLHTFIISNKE